MKLNTLFSINTVVAILFGIAFILIPAPLLSLYGVELNQAGLYIAQLLGTAFIGFGIVTWQARYASNSSALRAILLGIFLADILGFVITVFYQLRGIANSLGWSTAVIYLLLGLGFGYFYWRMRSET